ncbi:hypothetical protein SO802_029609 [Lithocarpus litseifolius]|uniref:Reverse transcriptase zinc-binding domain-containing protein n=1 Tax=Lithocarpus litseifolius TaxID=425828 RepID=A0AAW2BZ91_9ROSI
MVISPCPNLHRDAVVSTLIDADRAAWNHQAVDAFFLPLACKIKSIPLGSLQQADCLSWPWDKSGKIKHFLWRACTNALLIKTNLLKRKIITNAHCTICSKEPETIVHALWSCEAARVVWKKYLGWITMGLGRDWSFFDLLDKVRSQPHMLCLFVVTAWKIWDRRNKTRVGEVLVPIVVVVDSAWAYNADHQSIFKQKAHKPRPQNIKWKPPDERCFKVNFDGAMFDDTNEAGIGVIVRNSHGEVIASLSEKIQTPSLVTAL